MSNLVVPSFIVSLFTKEICNVHNELLLDISKTYGISYEELQKRYLPNVNVVSNELEKITISKKRDYKKNLHTSKYNAIPWLQPSRYSIP